MLDNVTKKQLQHIQNYSLQIIEDLPPIAIQQLLGGYEGDFDRLIGEIFNQTAIVMNFAKTIESEKLEFLSHIETSMDKSLKKLSYNYFKTTCLPNFRQEWRNLEWGNMIQLYPKSAYLCQRGSGKCFAPETEVLMYDGSIKEIKDIVVGDLLMGKDNTSRIVLSLHSGEDEMYEVEQKMFKNYTVNSKHDMYFKKWSTQKVNKKSTRCYDVDKAKEVVMEVKDFATQSDNYFRDIFGVGVDGWELEHKNLLVDPYYLGIWLGDGNKRNTEIASIDSEVIEYVYDYAEELGLDVFHNELSITYSLVSPS